MCDLMSSDLTIHTLTKVRSSFRNIKGTSILPMILLACLILNQEKAYSGRKFEPMHIDVGIDCYSRRSNQRKFRNIVNKTSCL